MSRGAGFEANDEMKDLVEKVEQAERTHADAVADLSEAMMEMRLTGRVFIEIGDQVTTMNRLFVSPLRRWMVRYIDLSGEVVLVEDIDSDHPPYDRYLKLHIGQVWLIKKGGNRGGSDRSPRNPLPDGPGPAMAAAEPSSS